MTYSFLTQWPSVERCPRGLADLASSLLQVHQLLHGSTRGLSRDLLWQPPAPHLNAIGNLLLHIAGSEHQWIGNKLGGLPLQRNRDAEFATGHGPPLAELLERLNTVEAQVRAVLARLDLDLDVEAPRYEGFSARFILHYTTQHVAYHAGQVHLIRRFFEPAFQMPR